MLIGLNGAKGVGKDTVGSYLVEKYEFERLSFAAKLKESAAALFGVDPDKWDEWKNDNSCVISLTQGRHISHGCSEPAVVIEMSARKFLQRYGTESHRDVFGYDFWVDALFDDYKGVQTIKNSCITDARFTNELERVHHWYGQNIRIIREDVVDGDTHVSELPPPQNLIDHTIYNNSTFEDLYEQVDAVLEKINPVLYAQL